MAIDLKNYKANKEIFETVTGIGDYFDEVKPNKPLSWCGVTALAFARIAIINDLKEKTPHTAEYIRELKHFIWGFQTDINKCTQDNGKGGKFD